MSIMTVQEKNVEIAKMLEFKKGFWYSVEKPVTENKKQFCKWDKEDSFFGSRVYPKEKLLFHSDVNWQFEALLYIRNVKWNISITNEQVAIFDDSYKYSAQGKCFLTEEETIKEAIFEALYLFSQYLKEKNEKKNKSS